MLSMSSHHSFIICIIKKLCPGTSFLAVNGDEDSTFPTIQPPHNNFY